MSLKFRKKIRVFPGFYLNLSKSGMSATVGIKGMSINIGQKTKYLNVGIPGIGIYDRVCLDGFEVNKKIDVSNSESYLSTVPDDAVEIKSYQPEIITSEGFYGLKESIINAQKVKEELMKESNKLFLHKLLSLCMLVISYLMIFGFFTKRFRNNYKEKSIIAKETKEHYQNFKLDIDFNLDQSMLNDFLLLKKSFEKVVGIDTIWDITSAKNVDRVKERSAANTTITRTKVKFSKSSLDFINTQYDALRFRNANGGDMYLYPGFIVMIDKSSKEFALIDFRDINIEHHEQRFIENERVPVDSIIVDSTWKYVNKNGTPDKRFKNNFQIPIALYYEIMLGTSKGLFESYQFSNAELGKDLCNIFEKYINSLKSMKWDNQENSLMKNELDLS